MSVPVAGETISMEDSSGGVLAVLTLKGLTAVVELVSATGKRTTKINVIISETYSTYQIQRSLWVPLFHPHYSQKYTGDFYSFLNSI